MFEGGGGLFGILRVFRVAGVVEGFQRLCFSGFCDFGLKD